MQASSQRSRNGLIFSPTLSFAHTCQVHRCDGQEDRTDKIVLCCKCRNKLRNRYIALILVQESLGFDCQKLGSFCGVVQHEQ